jgi:hypothetical protein
MRLLQLVGLACLAGLATTSPTPASPIKREVGSDLGVSRRLVVFVEDQFQGPSHDLEALNRCVKLESPVYKNLHSYGVIDQVCYFMDTDKCNGKVLITVDAQGRESWGRVDEGGDNDYAHRITSVYCSAQAFTDTAATMALSPGTVRACKYSRDTCSMVDALNSCKAFDDNIALQIDTLTQGGGGMCEYWTNKDCSRLVLTSISGSQDYSPNLGPGNRDGKEIGAVSCKMNRSGEGDGHGTTVHNASLDERSEKAPESPQPEDQADRSSLSNYSPLVVCHDVNLGGKCFEYSGPACAANPFNVDTIESIKLAQGYRCAFYPYWDCQATRGPPHYVDSKNGELIINDIEYEIWSMTCSPSPF